MLMLISTNIPDMVLDLWNGIFLMGNEFAKNVVIFGADMSLSVHVDNKKKDILILGEGSTQRLDDTTLTAEKSIQSTLLSLERNFIEACIIMEKVVYLFVNGVEIIKFKAKDPDINAIS